jgi:diguanylate cyclase (GGDEF)-like protein
MIPPSRDPEDGQTRGEQEQSRADSDQTSSDSDQTGSDRDQGAADLDQLAADKDQAASDRDLSRGADREVYDNTREARVRTTQARRETSGERHQTASARDETAHERDLSALARDRAAEARDVEDDGHDAEIASLTSFFGGQPATSDGEIVLRAARDRKRAASDRARSATRRADSGQDRERAASDRVLAAEDRVRSADDRAHATAQREADEVDEATGARRRGPGFADVQREIDRARRGDGRLIAAYVDVDGLKATNDSEGHRAGDVRLKRIVGVLRANLRSYEPIVRLGGDEFVCTISDTTIDEVHARFEEINAELGLRAENGSITVGFAELAQGDSPMDLIDRADRGLLATRNAARHDRAV